MRPPSPLAPSWYEQDLTQLADEQLVALAQEGDDRTARDEIVRRSLPAVGRLVGRYAARNGLQEADRQDARQAAVLWVLEAVECYRAPRSGTGARPAGCPFRNFLHRVVSARLVDYLRHLRHLQRHFPVVETALLDRNEGSNRQRHRSDLGLGGSAAGPQREVEEGEVRAVLHLEMAGLSGTDRTLWDLMAAGTPLQQVAAALDLSYHQVKRHRQKLIARLRSSLAGAAGAPPGRHSIFSHFSRPDSAHKRIS